MCDQSVPSALDPFLSRRFLYSVCVVCVEGRRRGGEEEERGGERRRERESERIRKRRNEGRTKRKVRN